MDDVYGDLNQTTSATHTWLTQHVAVIPRDGDSWIPAGGSYTCTFTGHVPPPDGVGGNAGETYTGTWVSASGFDMYSSPWGPSTDDATVTLTDAMPSA